MGISDDKKNDGNNINIDEEIRELVMARLKILDRNTIISIGSDGKFSPDELITHVEKGDDIGEKISEIQMEWLRAFKEGIIK